MIKCKWCRNTLHAQGVDPEPQRGLISLCRFCGREYVWELRVEEFRQADRDQAEQIGDEWYALRKANLNARGYKEFYGPWNHLNLKTGLVRCPHCTTILQCTPPPGEWRYERRPPDVARCPHCDEWMIFGGIGPYPSPQKPTAHQQASFATTNKYRVVTIALKENRKRAEAHS